MTNLRELIHLGFRRYAPHSALRPWVQSYWAVGATCNSSRELLYPDGGSSLIFDLAAHGRDSTLFTAHQTPQAVTVSSPLFGIRFHPIGAHQLLGLPIKELGGASFPAQLLLPNLSDLVGRLPAERIPNQIRLVDEWLLARANTTSRLEPLSAELLARIDTHAGPIQKLVGELGTSRRTAERLFKEQTGNTLGKLQAWSRVKRARQLIKLGQTHSLTEIGLICGYYDQSHFIREFKKTTTFTPMAYRKRQQQRISRGEMAIVNGDR